jgi:hypothetical protein
MKKVLKKFGIYNSNNFGTATKLSSDLQNASGVRLSTQTIHTRLHENGLRSRMDWRPALFTDAWTTQIGVLEYGEGQGNGSIHAMAADQ